MNHQKGNNPFKQNPSGPSGNNKFKKSFEGKRQFDREPVVNKRPEEATPWSQFKNELESQPINPQPSQLDAGLTAEERKRRDEKNRLDEIIDRQKKQTTWDRFSPIKDDEKPVKKTNKAGAGTTSIAKTIHKKSKNTNQASKKSNQAVAAAATIAKASHTKSGNISLEGRMVHGKFDNRSLTATENNDLRRVITKSATMANTPFNLKMALADLKRNGVVKKKY